MELEQEQEMVDRLFKLGFAGRIMTDGTDALLVSSQIALDEMSQYYPDLTKTKMEKILKKHNVLAFSDISAWERYRKAS